MAGLVVGAVGALGLENLDKSVKSASEAEQASELQVIGTVPKLPGSVESIQARIAKEAFRGLRTNLRFAMRKQARVVSVTSSEPGEGKTTVATNLAIALVEQGAQVVIVDADMRRPQLHGLFGVSRAPGLSEVLTGEAELESATKRYPQQKGLHVLPAGEPVDNSAELLGSESFEELLRCLEQRYDAVVIDTPPVLAFTDAALVAVLAGATVVVARVNKTDAGVLENAVNQLRRVGAPLVGLVLNGMPVDRTHYSYYKTYYTEDGSGRGRSSSAGTRKAG
jgi:capsular exopolysaccharide synthesis family protein